MTRLENLGQLLQRMREQKDLSQEKVAEAVGTNRSAVAHLEQGRRIPDRTVFKALCQYLGVPDDYWMPFAEPGSERRVEFEEALTELVGRNASLEGHDEQTVKVCESLLTKLFNEDHTSQQGLSLLNRVMVFYGVPSMSSAFFERYMGAHALGSTSEFAQSVRRFQQDGIRLFSTFRLAYSNLNESDDLARALSKLQARSDFEFRARKDWDCIEQISEDRLPDLGYIAAAKVKESQLERKFLADFLHALATQVRQNGSHALSSISEKKRRKVNTLLRKFGSSLKHDLSSTLFPIDADQLEREAGQVGPKDEGDLSRMGQTQATALRNLAHYLAADEMDVYVATSMRTEADFVSVSRFVEGLFRHPAVRPLKLRYFNPTQSWIDDRVAKGLVEALMLRRSALTIYMAQEADTFGKDSEASVALGQGKPVVVYVPKLTVPGADIDTERLGSLTQPELLRLLRDEERRSGLADSDEELDETADVESLHSQILKLRMDRLSVVELGECVLAHWADFDVYGKAERVKDEKSRAGYRAYLDAVIKSGVRPLPSPEVRDHVLDALVATAMRFERRAKVFKEVHPLALQVILSSGVLNGILVARSVESCAQLVKQLVLNELDLVLQIDSHNYRLIERTTGSTIRVISRNELLANAFGTFYSSVDAG